MYKVYIVLQIIDNLVCVLRPSQRAIKHIKLNVVNISETAKLCIKYYLIINPTAQS